MFIKHLVAWMLVLGNACIALGGQPVPETPLVNEVRVESAGTKPQSESEVLASKRYDEMLNKMQAAVEGIAGLYGNPTFLQVFTNDVGSASELRERLKNDRRTKEIRSEIEGLEKRRDELLSDIALKELQTGKLEEKLIRQRTALDALATAVEQARRAVEDTVK
jgi:hypothetical protein